MPYKETHNLQFRWEVFNATNTQRLTSVLGGTFAVGTDPYLGGANGMPQHRSAISLLSKARRALCSLPCAISSNDCFGNL